MFLSLLTGIGLAIACSIVFIYPWLFAKINKQQLPIQFAFVSSSMAFGLHFILTILFIPYLVMSIKYFPVYCHENERSTFCTIFMKSEPFIDVLVWAPLVVFIMCMPFILKNKFWGFYVSAKTS